MPQAMTENGTLALGFCFVRQHWDCNSRLGDVENSLHWGKGA